MARGVNQHNFQNYVLRGAESRRLQNFWWFDHLLFTLGINSKNFQL